MVDFSSGANRRHFEHVSLTDRYVYFWNEIAKRVTASSSGRVAHRRRLQRLLGPSGARKFHPNIAIRFVGISYVDEPERRQDVADWDAWAAAARKIYFRPNLLLAAPAGNAGHLRAQVCRGFPLPGAPFDDRHRLRFLLPQLGDAGTELLRAVPHCSGIPTRTWTPLSTTTAGQAFNRRRNQSKQYFMRLENLTDQIAAETLPVTQPYTPAVIDELRGYLDQAALATRRRTGGEPASGLSSCGSRIHGCLRRRLPHRPRVRRIRKPTDARVAAALPRDAGPQLGLCRATYFENHHLAVNVANVAWGSWGYFGRFGWNSPSVETTRQVEHPE